MCAHSPYDPNLMGKGGAHDASCVRVQVNLELREGTIGTPKTGPMTGVGGE